MARSNTPSSYKCSSCGVVGHNVRACTARPVEELSATARLRLERAARKVARLEAKAAKEAEKAAKAEARAAAKAERDAAKAAAKAAKVAAKAGTVVVVEPVVDTFIPAVVAHVDALIAEIEQDERERDAADLEAAIAATAPVVDEVVVAEPTVVVEDADLAALLAAIGHDAA